MYFYYMFLNCVMGGVRMQSIQWFPGHMAKARREIGEALKQVDAVLELVDARLPSASANPMLRELLGTKPRTVVMTRIDLADARETERWENHFRQDGTGVVCVDARTGTGISRVIPALEEAAVAKRVKDAKRGIRPRPLRTMVIGIPNVGKSSLINRLAKRAATKTGDRPGITKTQQWIRLGQVELLDTPGVLWPKFESEAAGFALAMSGAIKSDILDTQMICAYFIIFVSQYYPEILPGRYGIAPVRLSNWENIEENWPEVEPVIEKIAIQRGLVRTGGNPDLERAAELVLREAQTGKLGRITFERLD